MFPSSANNPRDTTPSPGTVLIAYVGPLAVYQVLFVGGSLISQTWNGTVWVSGDLDAATVINVDRCVFYSANDTSALAIWMIPLLTGTDSSLSHGPLTTLKLTNAKAPGATLTLNGSIRCVFGFDENGDASDYVKFQSSVAIAAGKVIFKTLLFINRDSDNQQYSSLEADNLDLDATALQTVAFQTFPHSVAPGGSVPGFSANGFSALFSAVGLANGAGNCYFDVGFIANAQQGPNSPQNLLRFSLTLPVAAFQSGSQVVLSPWQLQFPTAAYGDSASVTLVQRQPQGMGSVETAVETSDWIFEIPVPQRSVLDNFTSNVTLPFLAALDLVQSGQPLSTIPGFFGSDTQRGSWTAQCALVDNAPPNAHNPLDKTQVKLVNSTVTPFPHGQLSVVGRRLLPANPVPEVATLLNLPTLDDQSVQANYLPQSPIGVASDENQPNLACRGFCFNLQPVQDPSESTKAGNAQVVRMGALNLSFLPVTGTPAALPVGATTLTQGQKIIALWNEPSKVAAGAAFTVGSIVSYQGVYSLAVLAIGPGGQDDLPGEQYTPPLPSLDSTTETELAYQAQFQRLPAIVCAINSSASTPAWAWLTVTENIAPGSNQLLSMSLQDLGPTDTSGTAPSTSMESVLVLDSQPFLVAQVTAAPFVSGAASEVTNEIAYWSNSGDLGAGWQISVGSNDFSLTLPPQGLGEAMLRDETDGTMSPDAPADFRFTLPTVVGLSSSSVIQRLSEPAWNLRRLLGYPAETLPGSAINSLNFELIYGMTGTVSQAGLRLSEIEAQLGMVPLAQPATPAWTASTPQEDSYNTARAQWGSLYSLLKSRLAALEVWNPNQPAGLVLTDSDSLQYELRTFSSVQPSHLLAPVAIDPSAATSPDITKLFDPNGLAGGWSWGFESANILQSVLQNTVSTGAEASRLFFSALGGYGHQKADFANGRTAIQGETVMGRVSRLSIETIGRIGICWNRAKHVVVYERSVSASAQFFGEQLGFQGPPILRKVSEYIELLEEERAFPEGSTPAANRAFLRGVRFTGDKPPRIPVDSRWGSDVNSSAGPIGWKIPLWMRGAAPAAVYPKPVIQALVAGESADDTLTAAIDEPEKLYFFTNTQPGFGVDTDAWPGVGGIDFGSLPLDALAAETAKADGSNVDGSNNVAAYPVKVGTGRFTFRLAPGLGPTNLVEEKSSSVIRAVPFNVTVMRGAMPPNSTNTDNIASTYPHLALPDLLENVFTPLLTASAADLASLLADDSPLAPLTALTSGVQTLQKMWSSDSLCATLSTRMSQQSAAFKVQIQQELSGALQSLLQLCNSSIAAAKVQYSVYTHDAAVLLLSDVQTVATGVGLLLQSSRGSIGQASAMAGAAVTQINQLVARIAVVQKTATDGLGETGVSVPQAQTIARTFLFDVRDLISTAEFAVSQSFRQVLGDLQNSVLVGNLTGQMDLTDMLAQVNSIACQGTATIVADLIAEINKASTAAANYLTALSSGINAILAPLPQSAALQKYLQGFVNSFQTAVSAAVTWSDFDTAYQDLENAVVSALLSDPFSAELSTELQTDATQICQAMLPAVSSLTGALSTLATKLKSQLDDLATLPTSLFSTVQSELDTLYGSLKQTITSIVNRASLSLSQIANEADAIADTTLRLFRSFGDVPGVPQLNFNALSAAYYFLANGVNPIAELLPTVDLSGLGAEVNQLAGELNPIDLHVPIGSMLDHLIPQDLTQFDVSSVFRNFAGLNLGSLFQNIKLPALATDGVRVTHGENLQTRSGWLQVDVDVPFGSGDPETIFAVAGLTLTLDNAHFTGSSYIDATAGQTPTQTMQAEILGDWELGIGGTPLVTMQACGLQFDNQGHLHFDVSPDRVKLMSPLDFISELFASLNYSSQGFSIQVLPTGVRSVLSLPLPDIESGTFSIVNLSLGVAFEVGIDLSGGLSFFLRLAVSLASQKRPFTLTVFILGGAGALESNVLYKPLEGYFEASVAISIFASASLSISLGPISGGVFAYFGVTVAFSAQTGESGSLSLALVLAFHGEVSLLSLISVNIDLGLIASYDNGVLTGYGYVSYSIKIGWFIDINVSAHVEYTFGSAKSSPTFAERTAFPSLAAPTSHATPPTISPAQAYVAMFAL